MSTSLKIYGLSISGWTGSVEDRAALAAYNAERGRHCCPPLREPDPGSAGYEGPLLTGAGGPDLGDRHAYEYLETLGGGRRLAHTTRSAVNGALHLHWMVDALPPVY